MLSSARETFGIFFPHVLSIFAVDELVVLLPSVALEIVEIGWVIAVAVVSAKF